MKFLMKRAVEWLGMKRDLTVPPNVDAEFLLVFGDLLVGKLSVSDGLWRFQYSKEFRVQDDLRPLVEFPDLEKVYTQPELWQFFASRIPSTLQPDVEAVLEREHIEDDDIIALLKRFGKRTVTSPFELRYKDALT